MGELHVLSGASSRDQWDEAFGGAGNVVRFKPDDWIVVDRPTRAAHGVRIQGQGATLRADYDPKDGPILSSSHPETGRRWTGRSLFVNDLEVYGEDSHVGIDMPNANRAVLTDVRGTRLQTFARVRTVGDSGQVEHNTFERCAWSRCGVGLSYEANPAKPRGGHKGQRIWNCTGHETMLGVVFAQGTNPYTTSIWRTHMWFNGNLPWAIGLLFDGHMAGVNVDASFELAWKDRFDTRVVPVYAGSSSSAWEQMEGRLHLTNSTADSGMPDAIVQHAELSEDAASRFAVTSTP